MFSCIALTRIDLKKESFLLKNGNIYLNEESRCVDENFQ